MTTPEDLAADEACAREAWEIANPLGSWTSLLKTRRATYIAMARLGREREAAKIATLTAECERLRENYEFALARVPTNRRQALENPND